MNIDTKPSAQIGAGIPRNPTADLVPFFTSSPFGLVVAHATYDLTVAVHHLWNAVLLRAAS
jgi:hypothetical protein